MFTICNLAYFPAFRLRFVQMIVIMRIGNTRPFIRKKPASCIYCELWAIRNIWTPADTAVYLGFTQIDLGAIVGVYNSICFLFHKAMSDVLFFEPIERKTLYMPLDMSDHGVIIRILLSEIRTQMTSLLLQMSILL